MIREPSTARVVEHELDEWVPYDQWAFLEADDPQIDGPSTVPVAMRDYKTSLHFEDGRRVDITFGNDGWVDWLEAGRQLKRMRYIAVEVRPQIFFVNIHADGPPLASRITLAPLDLSCDRALVAFSRLEREVSAPPHRVLVKTEFVQAGVGVGAWKRFSRSSFFAGKRLLYKMGEDCYYDHVYFNSGTVAWYAITGPDRGQAFVEESKVFEVEDGLYLEFFTEGLWSIDSLHLVDFKTGRTTGRGFGWNPVPGMVFGGEIELEFVVLNETEYVQP